jgi:8-oxo-dGTP pyrophosphatase MutT (NUDIX family)
MPANTDGMWLAFGGVLVDDAGRVLLREPSGHYGGYVWTFAKGGVNDGDIPEVCALREVREETGYEAEILAPLPGDFRTSLSVTRYFLMKPLGQSGEPDYETQTVRWVTWDEARSLIALTRNADGRARDLAVLAAAETAWRALTAG